MASLANRLTLASGVAMCAAVTVNLLYFQDLTRAEGARRADALRSLAGAQPAGGRPSSNTDHAPRAAQILVPAATASTKRPEAAELPAARALVAPMPAPAASIGPSERSDGAVSVDTVRAIQRELTLRGYQAGVQDGRVSLITRAAIMAYEHDHGRPLTAEPTDMILKEILLGLAVRLAPGTTSPSRVAAPAAEQVVRTVQQSLATLGYLGSKVDGKPGDELSRAVREFEMDRRMPQTGRISGALILELARVVALGRRPVAHR
jgi:peptidoglycan hydrolase-like protein with peptidoglycan-binding domain